jgi:glycine cleavage system H protein
MTDDRPFHVPQDRHYDSKHHLWAQAKEGSGRVRIGIDSIGLESLGEIAYVALRDLGTSVTRGASIGTLEAAKMTSDIVAPVSGTITGRNEEVLRDPLLVNRDPYDGGWLVEIEARNWNEDASALVSGSAISGWVEGEIARLEQESGSGG